MNKLTSIVGLALIAGMAFPALAETRSALELEVKGNTGIKADSVEIEAETELESETEIELENGVLEVELEGNSTSSVRSESSDGDENSAKSDTDGRISVRAVTVRGWDADTKAEFMLNLKSALQVQTENELEHFAQGVLLKEENISRVEIGDDNVEVKFRRPAKLFGFIKSELSTTVTASNNSDVNVSFPWYRFMFKLSGDTNKAELEQSLSAKIAARATSQSEIQSKAILLETLSAAVATELEASIEADSSANATL